MKKTKLLHISANQYPDLVVDHHSKKIWKELALGFDEYHIIARSKNNKFHNSQEGNIKLFLVPALGGKARSFVFSSFYLIWLMIQNKYTHLLAQSAIFGGLPAIIVKFIYKIPLMVEIHGEEYFRILNTNKIYIKPLKHYLKFIYSNATVVRSLTAEMSRKLDVHKISKNVVLIPGRVDLAIFNKFKNDYTIKGPIKLISVGRFVKAKNYLGLISALSELEIDFHLTLIGGGTLLEEYIKLIKSKSMEKQVTLINWIDQKEMVDLLIDSDIYIQYSISEGMPRTILEAMSVALPIITTSVGSIKGVIKNNKNGIIVEVGNNNQLCERIFGLNQYQRKELGQAAHHDIIKHYEWNFVFNLYRVTILNMK